MEADCRVTIKMIYNGDGGLPLPDNNSSFRSPYEGLLNQACAHAQEYLASMHDRHVGVTQHARNGMLALGGAMPIFGEPADVVLRSLHEAGSPATTAIMGGRFYGGVIGGALPITVAAHWLADAWDQNACLYEISPISAYLEELVLSWLLDLFNLPSSAGSCLVGARHYVQSARSARIRARACYPNTSGLPGSNAGLAHP